MYDTEHIQIVHVYHLLISKIMRSKKINQAIRNTIIDELDSSSKG